LSQTDAMAVLSIPENYLAQRKRHRCHENASIACDSRIILGLPAS
jgi:hypothetical protein